MIDDVRDAFVSKTFVRVRKLLITQYRVDVSNFKQIKMQICELMQTKSEKPSCCENQLNLK